MSDASTEKIDPRLRQFMSYLDQITVLIQPRAGQSSATLIAEVKSIGGKVTGFSIQKMARVELPLPRVPQLDELDAVEKVLFDGDHADFFGRDPAPNSKLDRYLTELVSYLQATPVIVQTRDGLTEEDKKRVHGYGGVVKADLSIVNAYSAAIPLARLADLAGWERVVQITYDKTLIPS